MWHIWEIKSSKETFQRLSGVVIGQTGLVMDRCICKYTYFNVNRKLLLERLHGEDIMNASEVRSFLCSSIDSIQSDGD